MEDVKYLLSSHYQGTPYNPYSSRDTGKRGMYRSIGINRTGVASVCQIRPGMPEEIKASFAPFEEKLPQISGSADIRKIVEGLWKY